MIIINLLTFWQKNIIATNLLENQKFIFRCDVLQSQYNDESLINNIKDFEKMDGPQREQLKNFTDLTGTSEKIAQKYLVKTKWNFQNAINMFYDEGAPMPEPEKVTTLPEVEKFWQENAVAQDGKKIIDETGLQKLFSSILKLDMQNIVIGHIMVNVMEMQKAGIADKQNLYNLFTYTKTKSFKEFASKVPQLEEQIHERKDLFKKMYNGFFDFYSVTKSPTMDFEIAVQLWSLYLKDVLTFHKEFMEFLDKLQNKPVKIYRDLWKMTYQFSVAVKKLSDYNEEGAWPVLLDDFIVFVKEKGVK